MKYQSLVSSTTPADLQDWLGQELEDRGIDSVYARSILSLLQQDNVDIEPRECQHFQNRQSKVLQKYGGPENLDSATKSKHQKWRTWGKQMLLPSSSCCKAVNSDLERIKKQAAVDCLRSATDYADDIEELIDEVWIKLKNIKNLQGEKDEIHRRKKNDEKVIYPFFIPPSSPTDEIEKYFAAFPSLNDKREKETEIFQHNTKNAWCKACVKKNPKSHASNKCNQPIIPYSPLKQIKAIYQNTESTVLLDHDKEIFSIESLKVDVTSRDWKINHAEEIELTKKVLLSVKGSWKEMYSFISKSIALSILDHLYFIQINECFLYKENNFNSENDLKLSTKQPSPFMKTLFKSNFIITKADDKPSNEGEEKNVLNPLISFQKVIYGNLSNCADFKDPVMPMINNCQFSSGDFDGKIASSISERKIFSLQNTSNLFEQPRNLHLSFEGNKFDNNLIDYSKVDIPVNEASIISESNCQVENITADIISKENNMKSVCNLNPDTAQFSDSFETEKQCNLMLLPTDLVANDEKLNSLNLMTDSPSADDDLDRCNLRENFSFGEKDNFHSNHNIDIIQKCMRNIVICESDVGQQLLKQVLCVEKNLFITISKTCSPSTSSEITVPLIHLNNKMMSKEPKSQAFVNSNESIAYVPRSKDYVQSSNSADWSSKSTKILDEKWLLYWGDNHNFIARTWQKDFAPSESIQNVELPIASASIIALSKEIKEDGDELLKELNSIPRISNDPVIHCNEIPIFERNYLNSDSNINFQTSSNIECDEVISFAQQTADSQNFDDLNDGNVCSPAIHASSYMIDNIERASPQMLPSFASQNQFLDFKNNSFKATDYTNLSAFPNSYESVNSIESDDYMEGGGWSFTSVNYLDFPFVNSNERSCSVDNLDLENSEYSEFAYQKRIRCISETDDNIRNQNQSQPRERLRKPRKRVCLFYLQGTCRRTDCRFSHDFSTTTCRFWREGSCFKGDTCPFLHGYTEEIDRDLLHSLELILKDNKGYSYSLESETDFPSLSSAKPEPSKSKSSPINIVHKKK